MLEKWIKEERKRWDIDPNDGHIVKKRHRGIELGNLSGLKPNETVLKATKDEWVFTSDQYNNLTKNLSKMENLKGGQNTYQITIEKLLDVDKISNDTNVKEIATNVIREITSQLKGRGFIPAL